ncbi:hypothetical protein M707_26225 [Arthrobacter sp. AK-YN10]|nr:hypothetical protein M707_26225 [Arthrobacter sp. AK-YN10]
MPITTKTSIPEPYASKVRARILASIKKVNGCWEWQKSLSVRGGYAQMMLSIEPKKPQLFSGHRASWLAFKGDIAEGLHLDHLCRNHKCVNPDHLEPVTLVENSVRGGVAREGMNVLTPLKECRHGHPMTGDNLYAFTSTQHGPRVICNSCRKASAKRANEKIKHRRRQARIAGQTAA